MAGIVISENDFARLSAPTQQELLGLLQSGVDSAADQDALEDTMPRPPVTWDPEGEEAFPLAPREAKELLRGIAPQSKAILRSFCENLRNGTGWATIEELMTASGHDSPQGLMKAMPAITRRLRTVTGNKEAWIFDWYDEDWEWDRDRKTWAKGLYFIPSPAILSLRQAFGMEGGRGAVD